MRADKEIVRAALQVDSEVLQHALLDLSELRPLWMEKLKACGLHLKAAPEALRADQELVLVAVKAHPQALEHAQSLRGDRSFVLSLVRATKAAFLTYWAADELRKDRSFAEECRRVAGRGLVWTWYDHPSVFAAMRERFPTTGASVPGGEAYLRVMEQLQHDPHGGASGHEPPGFKGQESLYHPRHLPRYSNCVVRRHSCMGLSGGQQELDPPGG